MPLLTSPIPTIVPFDIVEAISATPVLIGTWAMSFADADPSAYEEGDAIFAVLAYKTSEGQLAAALPAPWVKLIDTTEGAYTWRVWHRTASAELIAGDENLPSWAGALPVVVPQAVLVVVRSAQPVAASSDWWNTFAAAGAGSVSCAAPFANRTDDLVIAVAWTLAVDGEPSAAGVRTFGDDDNSAGYFDFGKRHVGAGGWVFARWYTVPPTTDYLRTLLHVSDFTALEFAVRTQPVPRVVGVVPHATPGRIGLL